MRRFLVDRTSIENVNVVQLEAEVEEPPPNVANEFNPNEIVRDPGLRKQIHLYAPDIQDDVRMAYVLKGPMQPKLTSFPRTPFAHLYVMDHCTFISQHTAIIAATIYLHTLV